MQKHSVDLNSTYQKREPQKKDKFAEIQNQSEIKN